MSLPIDELIETIKRLAPTIPGSTLTAIQTDLETKEAEKAAEREENAEPKAKNTFVPIILDPAGRLAGHEFPALIVQVPQGLPLTDILPRLHRAAYDQNAQAKRKRYAFDTLAELAAHGKARFQRECQVRFKTKEIVPVLLTDGVIPKGS